MKTSKTVNPVIQKTVLALLAIICIEIGQMRQLQAQDFVGKIVVGLNASQIDGDLMAGFNQPGFVGGGAVEYFIDDRWAIEGQLLYSMKGSRSSDDEFQRWQIQQQWRLNYLDIPLMLNFYPREKLMFQGGIGLNYYLSGYFEDSQQNRIEFDSGMEPFDVMMMFGFEYQVLYRIALGVRYGYSLFPINDVPLTQGAFVQGPLITGGQTGAYNNVLSFTIKYLLNPDDRPQGGSVGSGSASPAGL